MIFWVLDNLKFQTEDTLWIGIQRGLSADFAVEARLRREYPSLDLRLVFLDFQTRGAAETLFIMLQVTVSEGNQYACSIRDVNHFAVEWDFQGLGSGDFSLLGQTCTTAVR